MNMQSKPIVALASGAMLLVSALCQTAHAQSTNAILAANNGVAADDLTVVSSVTESSGIYTYTYVVKNPSPAIVEDLDVGFVAYTSGAVFDVSSTGAIIISDGSAGVTWGFTPSVAAGTPGSPTTSVTLSFESDFPPIPGNANAAGSGGTSPPWASSPNGTEIYVPAATPEPTTISLIALALLIPAFRPNLLKRSFAKLTSKTNN